MPVRPEDGLSAGRYGTPWGTGFVACRDGRVSRIWLPGEDVPDDIAGLALPGDGTCAEACRQLEEYFRGERRQFSLEPDLSGATPFAETVLRAAMRIPWGELRSYGWLAAGAGKPGAARACGQVMARNRLPVLVPCHRVVAADGRPGGYSAGLHWKQRLLSLEGSWRGMVAGGLE